MTTKIQNNYKYLGVLAPLLIAILMVCVEYTGIAIAIPKIATDLNLSVSTIKWVTTAYLIAFSSLVVASGQLSDRVGHKKMLGIGLIIFGIASFLGGISSVAGELIVSRFMQGVGAAIIWPSSTALAFNCMPQSKKYLAIGIVTGIVGASMAIGPLLAGYCSQVIGWKYFFLLNTPLSIVSLFMLRFLHLSIHSNDVKAKLDLIGICSITFSLLLISFALNNLHYSSKEIVLTLSSLFFGALLIAFFVRYELSTPNAFLNPEIIKNRVFAFGCLLRCLMNFSFYMFLFTMGLFLISVKNYSPVISGVIFLPMTIAIAITSPFTGFLLKKINKVLMATLGVIIFFAGYYIFSKSYDFSIGQMLAAFILPGLAYGILSPSLLAITMTSVQDSDAGVASGIFYMFSLLSSSFGVAVSTFMIGNSSSIDIIKNELKNSLSSIMIVCCIAMVFAILIIATLNASYFNRRKFNEN